MTTTLETPTLRELARRLKALEDERSQRAELERMWRRERAICHVALQAIPQAVIAYDQDLEVVYSNARAKSLGGLDTPATIDAWLEGARVGSSTILTSNHWEGLLCGRPMDPTLMMTRGQMLSAWAQLLQIDQDDSVVVVVMTILGA